MDTAPDSPPIYAAFCGSPLLLIAAITCLIVGLVRKSRSWKVAAGVSGLASVLAFVIPLGKLGGEFAKEMAATPSAQTIPVPGTPGRFEAPRTLAERSAAGGGRVAVRLESLPREGMVAVLVSTLAEAAVTDPASFESYAGGIAKATAKAMGGPGDVPLEAATFGGLAAFRYSFDAREGASGDRITHLGCLIQGREHLYQIVCETRPSRKTEWTGILDDLLASFTEEPIADPERVP